MDSSGGCPHHFKSCGESMQSNLDSPMPWIGMYVAAATAIITIAMAADVLHGFKYRKWWLPSKHFSINAFSLTVIAVAMKLPVDLTNQMLGVDKILARVSSLALMSTIIGNLMTSLAAMESNEIMLNLSAIATFVITIMVNVFIHISSMVDTAKKEFRHAVISQIYVEQIICTVCMFILLLMFCLSGMSFPKLRRMLDKEHSRLNEKDSTKQVKWGRYTIDELRAVLRDYWVNAKILNPQFLIASSEMSFLSGAICLLTALTLLEAWLRLHLAYDAGAKVDASNYNWSINWILIIQDVGVGLGTVAPVLRWLNDAKFSNFIQSLGHDFWAPHDIVKWAGSPRSSKIQSNLVRCIVSVAKSLVVIFVQIVMLMTVLGSLPLFLVSLIFGKIILLPFPHDESIEEIESAWIALRKGEGVTTDNVKSICSELDELIEIAEKKQPVNLIKLLKKSGDFNGVRDFVDQPISGLEDVLNCWSLSVVILSSIAVQLPNIPRAKIDEFQSGVTEGLHFLKPIEKSLNMNLERYGYRLEANDLRSHYRALGTCKLIYIKKETFEETRNALDVVVAENEPSDILTPEFNFQYCDRTASRSIAYISATIVRYIRENPGKTEADLFDRISVMIADLLSACLTNLVPLITFMCTNSTITEREETVREAAVIFGQTREILEMLQKRRLPELDPDKAALLHEWRSFMEHNPNWMASI